MRTLILAACAALLVFAAPAKASFSTDDRYFDSRARAAPQKVKARKVAHRKIRQRHVRKVVSRRASQSHEELILTTADENSNHRRETIHYTPQPDPTPAVRGPRPRAWCGWCGWWLGRQLGMLSRNLWLARNWASVGSPSGKHVGAIVVWNHHVGRITGVRADGAIKVLSGNDGHAVRDRWRSARGVIAYRAL